MFHKNLSTTNVLQKAGSVTWCLHIQTRLGCFLIGPEKRSLVSSEMAAFLTKKLQNKKKGKGTFHNESFFHGKQIIFAFSTRKSHAFQMLRHFLVLKAFLLSLSPLLSPSLLLSMVFRCLCCGRFFFVLCCRCFCYCVVAAASAAVLLSLVAAALLSLGAAVLRLCVGVAAAAVLLRFLVVSGMFRYFCLIMVGAAMVNGVKSVSRFAKMWRQRSASSTGLGSVCAARIRRRKSSPSSGASCIAFWTCTEFQICRDSPHFSSPHSRST